MRPLMYELLTGAFAITALSWWDRYREHRGDGALVVAPPDIESERFLDPLVHHLTALLRRHAWQALPVAGGHVPVSIPFLFGYSCSINRRFASSNSNPLNVIIMDDQGGGILAIIHPAPDIKRGDPTVDAPWDEIAGALVEAHKKN